MMSKELLKKWERLLRERYKKKNLNKREVFEIAKTLTDYYGLLMEFDHSDKKKEINVQNNE